MKYPLSPEEFRSIYSRVPRLTVEVIVRSTSGVLLTRRAIEPCKGQWHIPGGTVLYGESMDDAVRRVSEKELGIIPTKFALIDIIEYPSFRGTDYGDPRGVAYTVDLFEGVITLDEEASEYGWFTAPPDDIVVHQGEFLQSHGLVSV